MKNFTLITLLLLPLLASTQESLALSILDQNGDEFAISTYPDGLIARIEYRNLQGKFPKSSTVVRRNGPRLAWDHDRRLTGTETFFLNRERGKWSGTRTFPAYGVKGVQETRPIEALWSDGPSRLWTDERVSALLFPGHYVEESAAPFESQVPTESPLVYDLQGKVLLENYRGRLNAKINFARTGAVVQASRFEDPEDGGWRETGRSTLSGRSLWTNDPAINAANWKILSTVIEYPVYLPFLLGWSL